MFLRRAFFELPEAAKRTVQQDGNNRGWTAMGEETLDPARQTCGDTKEGYYIGREVAAGAPEHGRPVQVEPMKPVLKAPGTKRLKLKYNKLLSSLAFKFNLRRYSTASPCAGPTTGRTNAPSPSHFASP